MFLAAQVALQQSASCKAVGALLSQLSLLPQKQLLLWWYAQEPSELPAGLQPAHTALVAHWLRQCCSALQPGAAPFELQPGEEPINALIVWVMRALTGHCNASMAPGSGPQQRHQPSDAGQQQQHQQMPSAGQQQQIRQHKQPSKQKQKQKQKKRQPQQNQHAEGQQQLPELQQPDIQAGSNPQAQQPESTQRQPAGSCPVPNATAAPGLLLQTHPAEALRQLLDVLMSALLFRHSQSLEE